jgi:predicted O-methyltransferase YrrM
MAHTYEVDDWRRYEMNWYDPFRQLEPLEKEIATVEQGLATLVEAQILPHARYDYDKMLAHRNAVRRSFDIPWTAISPRMERLLYAINAVAQPQVMVAVGIFCGNTFIANAGAAIGPGVCYTARRLVGIEIVPSEADRARRNVATLAAPDGVAEIIAADGIPWLERYEGTIDLLYLDADGPRGKGKSIYLDLLLAATHALRPGSLVLAHNSFNSASTLRDYLDYVRDAAHLRDSANMIVDDQGLEVSVV